MRALYTGTKTVSNLFRRTAEFVGEVLLHGIEAQIRVGVETTLGIFDEVNIRAAHGAVASKIYPGLKSKVTKATPF